MVTRHTVNRRRLPPGDRFGSATQSRRTHEEEAGSPLEFTMGGERRSDLGNGEARTSLEDGDAVIFPGWCEREVAARIGFGEVRSMLLPA